MRITLLSIFLSASFLLTESPAYADIANPEDTSETSDGEDAALLSASPDDASSGKSEGPAKDSNFAPESSEGGSSGGAEGNVEDAASDVVVLPAAESSSERADDGTVSGSRTEDGERRSDEVESKAISSGCFWPFTAQSYWL